MKPIQKKYYPVFSIFNVKTNTIDETTFGQGHSTLGDAFVEGIKHYQSNPPEGREMVMDDGIVEYVRMFEWSVRDQYVWTGNKDSDAKQYIGEEE